MKIAKIGLIGLGLLLLLVLSGLTYLSIAFPKVSEAPDIQIDGNAKQVARGKYLAYHVMMCADCHSKRDFSKFSAPPSPGTEFTGGEVFDHSMGLPGVFISPNITPYGIGGWTDGELYRLITAGVRRDGEPIFPIMPYHSFGKSDPEDIKAVIAYLRTLDPVEKTHPERSVDFPVNFIMRTMPKDPEPMKKPEPTDLLAYGKYMFTAAACGDCHTKMEGGSFVGPVGGGGREFGFPDGSILRTPNLTPHETGIKYLSESDFIQRFKQYDVPDSQLATVQPGEFQTIMPWKMYAGMQEEDLRAIYHYLMSLAPYEHAVERFTPAKP
ncbi:c-type cytochrome [Algoriphagus hitonicola]|uniref:Cytochrome c, mono-and diheme variants n=1 Tax=Algoriphagus hitonicola TaxID=435880 RepID=A0A1I2NF73_9BACT|nr:cytochrome c [Algoriphagus hitonicola]SFG02585.1 Cytochrome c, mono-and diheme variants [Algoriphagus hitonicola]